jgi:hypothetical protein
MSSTVRLMSSRRDTTDKARKEYEKKHGALVVSLRRVVFVVPAVSPGVLSSQAGKLVIPPEMIHKLESGAMC